jgi:hypothetical protein
MDKHRNATLFSKMESNEGEMEKLEDSGDVIAR